MGGGQITLNQMIQPLTSCVTLDKSSDFSMAISLSWKVEIKMSLTFQGYCEDQVNQFMKVPGMIYGKMEAFSK